MKHTADSSPHAASDAVAAVHGGHEERDVTFRPIVIGSLVMVGFLVFSFFFVHWLLAVMGKQETALSPRANPLAAQYGRRVAPEPRLQAHPRQDLLDMRKREDAVLNNYAWIDESAGSVRLPIGRAMELLAKRGLPSRPVKEAQP